MKTVFVYEHCTALGLGRNPSDPAHSFYREGKAMRDAVIADFQRIVDVTVVTLDDQPIELIPSLIKMLAASNTATFLIAPEISGDLRQSCVNCDIASDKRLGCNIAAIKLTSDKLDLAEHWLANGIPTPITIEYNQEEIRTPPETFPVILKPLMGAGSWYSWHIPDLVSWQTLLQTDSLEDVGYRVLMILQPYIPGRPASVAFLVGTQQTIPLLPCWQHIADDGRFTYLGGEIIEEDALLMRAVKLARRAIDCVPGLLGYIGVDLILGESADGSEDYALEINPRLTTSYVGLREMTDDNLMEIMWALCRGESGFRIAWKPDRVLFQADGTVERISRR